MTKKKAAEKLKSEEKVDVEETIKTFASDWMGKLLVKGKENLDKVPPQMRGSARIALAYVEENKTDFIDLGEQGFAELLGLLCSDAKGKARDHYIRTQLGPDGLIVCMMDTNVALEEAVTKAKKCEQQFYAFLNVVGGLGVNLLRSLLLGV